MIKTIIFDYGNIIATNPNKFIFDSISKKFNIKHEKVIKESIRLIPEAQKNQILENTFWKRLSQAFGLADPDNLKKAWMQDFKRHLRINENLISLIRELNKKNFYTLCLLSNTTKFYKNESPYTDLLRDLFQVRIYSCDVKARKPEEQIFNIMLEKLKADPKNCIFIDDQKINLIYPREIGMDTILFESCEQLRSDLVSKSIL